MDRRVHEIRFFQTLKEIELPVPTCAFCNTTDGPLDIYNPGFIEICKACEFTQTLWTLMFRPCGRSVTDLIYNAVDLRTQNFIELCQTCFTMLYT